MNHIHKFNYDITVNDREKRNGHKSSVIWMTGLSGSGKSTIANILNKALFDMGYQVSVLDGDSVRLGLNSDLGFSEKDRTENLRRVSHVANVMSQTGQIVICCFISPRDSDRKYARSVCSSQFFEVHISTSLEVCENRDPKGLYKKARQGVIPNFTGVSDVFEVPKQSDIVLDTAELSAEQCSQQIIEMLMKEKVIQHALTVQGENVKSKKIAIDFDGVIHAYTRGFQGLLDAYDVPHPGAKEALETLTARGYQVMIFSSRPSYVIEDWLLKHDMKNLVSGITNLKVAASYYIDDHAIEFEKGSENSWKRVLHKILEGK